MSRRLTIIGAALLLPLVAARSGACSLVGCSNDGIEVRPDFSISITHGKSPLAGVAVEITGGGKRYAYITGTDGKVRVSHIEPGMHWLNAQFLGIGAIYTCFHISSEPSTKAKRQLTYTWGDDAPASQRIAGKLIDSQSGKGGTPLWNIVHPLKVPIVGATLKLQDPMSGAVYTTISDNNGEFAYNGIASGIYVLHVEGGNAGDAAYDSTDELIELSPEARSNMLKLTRSAAAGGSCGGTILELQTAN